METKSARLPFFQKSLSSFRKRRAWRSLTSVIGFFGWTISAKARAFFFEPPALTEGSALIGKKSKAEPAQIKEALLALKDRLPPDGEWSVVEVEASLRAVAGESELKPRDVFLATRVAVTGRLVSTPLFETLTALGRSEVSRRLETALSLL